jgi:cyclic beta-1,2-glucan synthetase
MLRLGLIENLQRITTRLTHARQDRDLADLWVDRLQEMAERTRRTWWSWWRTWRSPICRCPVRSWRNSASVCRGAARCCISRAPGSNSGWSNRGCPSNSWFNRKAKSGGRPGFRQPQYRQPPVFERHGLEGVRGNPERVEQTLRSDPAGVYGAMDFATRDRYRHAVESLARHSRLSGSGRRAARHPTGRGRQRPAKGVP